MNRLTMPFLTQGMVDELSLKSHHMVLTFASHYQLAWIARGMKDSSYFQIFLLINIGNDYYWDIVEDHMIRQCTHSHEFQT